MEDKLNALLQDKALAARLPSMDSAGVQAAAAEKGVALSAEEAGQLLNQVAGELSTDALESVAGGMKPIKNRPIINPSNKKDILR